MLCQMSCMSVANIYIDINLSRVPTFTTTRLVVQSIHSLARANLCVHCTTHACTAACLCLAVRLCLPVPTPAARVHLSKRVCLRACVRACACARAHVCTCVCCKPDNIIELVFVDWSRLCACCLRLVCRTPQLADCGACALEHIANTACGARGA